MLSTFFHGIGFGLVLTIMVGPVFFGLLQTSISKGFRQGIFYALGVSLSDIALIFLTYFGISVLLENITIKNIVTLIGGIVTIVFGIVYLVRPAAKAVPVADLPKGKEKSNIIIKGFLLNFLNPSVLFFWIGTVSLVSVSYSQSPWSIFLFFAGIIIALLSADILKAYIAHKIKVYVTDKLMAIFNKILGVIFIIAGMLILWRIF